jgi:outer membrane protein OmpA-like peptidoglycan-associated protein
MEVLNEKGITMLKGKFKLAAVPLAVSLVVGCATTNPYTNEKETSNLASGATIGAITGVVIGLLAGGDSKERKKNALLGLAVGGAAGGGVGYYMDVQEAKLRQRLRGTGVSVSRMGNDLVLNMPGNVTFSSNGFNINSGFYPVLESVFLVFQEYESTIIRITGFTDSSGSSQYNQTLSEKRANSVADYFRSKGVSSQRFLVAGAGETQPVASNDTAGGRSQNRRVELLLSPIS